MMIWYFGIVVLSVIFSYNEFVEDTIDLANDSEYDEVAEYIGLWVREGATWLFSCLCLYTAFTMIYKQFK